MKIKCNSCGKKEAEIMSKMEIKTSNFVDASIASKVLDIINDWTAPKFIVCKACGHTEKA